jgi:hypothetical protein
MKKQDGKTYWKIGQRVKYKFSGGDKICLITKTSPYNEHNKSHYVELIEENTGKKMFSAYDKNLVSLEK